MLRSLGKKIRWLRVWIVVGMWTLVPMALSTGHPFTIYPKLSPIYSSTQGCDRRLQLINGKCIAIFHRKVDFMSAYQICASLDAVLYFSSNTDEIINLFHADTGSDLYWVGAITAKEEYGVAKSIWIFNYNMIPNITYSVENFRERSEKCIAFNFISKQLENYSCENEFGFVCRDV